MNGKFETSLLLQEKMLVHCEENDQLRAAISVLSSNHTKRMPILAKHLS